MKRWGVLIAVLAIFLGSVALPVITNAQEQPTPARKLQISPLHTFISIAPGESYAGAVQLKNTGTETLLVNLSAEAFNVKNEQYDYIFMPDSPVNNWVRFLTPELSLKPGQSYDAKFLISVPIEAEPGGVYISIFAASLPTSETSIQSVDRVGSLFYIDITGEITKKGELISFSAPWVHTSGTIPWSETIRNAGSTHFSAKSDISIQTLWGNKLSSSTANPLILPNSVRLVSGSLEQPQWLGIYTVTYNVELGDNEAAQGSRMLLYLPLSQLIALLALGVAIIMVIVHIIRKFKRKRTAQK